VRRFITLLLMSVPAAMLAACGGSRHAPVVENPYAESAQSFAMVGVDAMQRERWDAAERSFERELVAAQMADEMPAVVLAHYNLGMVWLAAGQHEQGRQELQRTLILAQRHGLDVMAARALLALALDQARAGTVPTEPAIAGIRASWPADVQLSAGRLALYRHDLDGARQAYTRALHQAGSDRGGIILQARAHLGLAMAAQAAKDEATSRSELQQTLQLCRKAGAPRVAADALMMLASGEGAVADRHDALERALAIYQNLQDKGAQHRALTALVALTTGDERARWQKQLDALGANEAVPASKDAP
jgi:tetratricopeptide (TPR) repeat protein